MTDEKLRIVSKQKELEVDVMQKDRVVYTIPCINECHFYTVLLLAQKKLEGENVESAILGLKRD